jgi:molecular chaperone HtpG
MLSEEKFFEKAEKFALYPSVNNEYFTYEELEVKIKDAHTDKDGKLVLLYASNLEEQHSYIEAAKEKGYTVLLLDSPIVPHLLQKLETSKENISFARVDSDAVENLIKKEEESISKLDETQITTLKEKVEDIVKDTGYIIQTEALSSDALPFMLTEPEFMRRMKDMQKTGGGGFMGQNMPDMYNLVINTNHPLASEILETKTDKKREKLIRQALDLAKLSKGVLKGADLSAFIKRSVDLIK